MGSIQQSYAAGRGGKGSLTFCEFSTLLITVELWCPTETLGYFCHANNKESSPGEHYWRSSPRFETKERHQVEARHMTSCKSSTDLKNFIPTRISLQLYVHKSVMQGHIWAPRWPSGHWNMHLREKEQRSKGGKETCFNARFKIGST